MKFKEARNELDKGRRIWHPKWNKNGFIFKDIFDDKTCVLTLWDEFVSSPTEPRFKGVDDRLYSMVGSFWIKKDETSDTIIDKVRALICEYFNIAQYVIGQMGFKIEENKLKDEWEVL